MEMHIFNKQNIEMPYSMHTVWVDTAEGMNDKEVTKLNGHFHKTAYLGSSTVSFQPTQKMCPWNC